MAKAFLAISSRCAGSRRGILRSLAGAAALVPMGGLAAVVIAAPLWAGLVFAQDSSVPAPVELALGQSDAPVTVVEYFSFSCSHCARFHWDTFPGLKRNYIDTGKVRFVVRDFPLNMAALAAATLARCIGPERYFEAVNILWSLWDDWINEADTGPTLVSVLSSEGFDESLLQRCLNDKAFEDQVLASYVVGSRDHGVDQTPTFLINGKKYIGLSSYGRFAAILDSLLE